MKIEPLYEFEEVLKQDYSIQDQIHLGVAYYVYCDLKIKEIADLDKTLKIKNQISLLIEILISSKNLEELKQKILGGEYNDELKLYIDLIFAQKNHSFRKIVLCEKNDERIVRNIDEFLPFAKKQNGRYEGYIAVTKYSLDLYLLKLPNENMEYYHEVYMVKLHQILVGRKSSYEIFLISKNFGEKLIHRNNSFIGVKLIENTSSFENSIINNLKIKKPVNLIKNLVVSGMIGNTDCHLSNILFRDHARHRIFNIIDLEVMIANRNKRFIKRDFTLEILDLFKNFIFKEYNKDIKVLFIKYFKIIQECVSLGDKILYPRLNAIRFNKIFNQIFEKKIIEQYLDKLTDQEILDELLEIKNNIDFDQIDNLYQKFKDFEYTGLGMKIEDYHKITKNVLRIFKENFGG